ncbi:ABC transporter substrate-binding protein [Cupriavidus necator]|uniref:Amino acid/amide ABC transporter substrate-binding protein, HAAT family n=1 Tax=Cupriavidus pinatubonensis (strain JMP 134 / LMG 1197) TaxID=264198 RepID=Q46MJ7_CUPPJ|nr:ABC transporter substrate-binding protein [Cupriavidus necator]
MSITRRNFLSGAAGIALSTVVKPSFAQSDVIRIGVPTGITGNWSALGAQVQRACKLFAKNLNAKGGIDGKKVEFIYEDTQGDPAACVRKVTELVEGRGVKLITGVISSGESLAIMPRLAGWDALYLASISGVGSLTGANYVPNAFRTCTSGPMRARAISLWLAKSPKQRFFTIAQDYAWGKNSLATFEKLITDLKKQPVGNVLSPLGTKDYSSYIARIREARPDVLYVAMSGDDATAFLKQAGQYRLAERMEIVTEVLDMLNTKPLGDTGLGLAGISQYNYAYDTQANAEFVRMFKAEYGDIPDTWEGETWQCLEFLAAGIRKAKSTDTTAIRKALEGMEIATVKGTVTMRACDHQAEQPVFMARLDKDPAVRYPTPKIIDTYQPNVVVPGCRKDSY